MCVLMVNCYKILNWTVCISVDVSVLCMHYIQCHCCVVMSLQVLKNGALHQKVPVLEKVPFTNMLFSSFSRKLLAVAPVDAIFSLQSHF